MGIAEFMYFHIALCTSDLSLSFILFYSMTSRPMWSRSSWFEINDLKSKNEPLANRNQLVTSQTNLLSLITLKHVTMTKYIQFCSKLVVLSFEFCLYFILLGPFLAISPCPISLAT